MQKSKISTPSYSTQTDRIKSHCTPPGKVIWDFVPRNDKGCTLTATLVDSTSQQSCAEISYIGNESVAELVSLDGSLKNNDGTTLSISMRDLYRSICSEYNAFRPLTVSGGSQSVAIVVPPYRSTTFLRQILTSVIADFQKSGWNVSLHGSSDASGEVIAGIPVRRMANRIVDASAITDSLVLVVSLFDLPLILQSIKSNHQKVVHLCTELEEFTHGSSLHEVLSRKEIFNFFNSLPVERWATSEAIKDYYEIQYQQECCTIIQPLSSHSNKHNNANRMSNVYAPLKVVAKVSQNGPRNGILTLLEALVYAASLVGERGQLHAVVLLESGVEDCYTGRALPAKLHLEVIKGCDTDEVLRHHLSHASLFIDPSFHSVEESIFYKVIAASVPIIKTDTYALHTDFSSGKDIFTVPRNNVIALATAIVYVLQNDDLREAMVHQCKEKLSKIMGRVSTSDICSLLTSERSQRYLCAPLVTDQPTVSVTEPPTFSVLIPVYNHDQYLGEALDTVIAQTYPHWEAVVVNDGSTDRTPEVMSAYAKKDSRIKLFHKENGGTASALNAALQASTAEWKCWLSSDDFFKHNKLEIHANFIRKLPQIKFFHSRYSIFNHHKREEDATIVDTHKHSTIAQLQSLQFGLWNYVHGNTIAAHKDLFDQVGLFSRNYPNAQDYDMWLKMSFKTPFVLIDQITCTTRIHDATGTSQFPQAGLFDSYRSFVDTVNPLTFEELFPFVDFDSVAEASNALREAINISLMPSAFIYQGVLQDRSILIEKMRAWISHHPRRAMYEQLASNFAQQITQQHNARNSKNVLLTHLAPLIDRASSLFTYEPIDPFFEYIRTYEFGRANHRQDVCGLIARYINKLKKHNVVGVPSFELDPEPLLHSTRQT